MCGFVWVCLSCFVYTSAEVMYSVHILVHKQYTMFGSIMMKFVIHGLPVDLYEGTENPGNHQRLEGSSLRTFLTVHHVGNVHMPTFWNGGWKVPRYWKKWPSAGALNQKPIRLSLKSAEINMRTKILRLYFRQYYYKSSIKTSVVSVAATFIWIQKTLPNSEVPSMDPIHTTSIHTRWCCNLRSLGFCQVKSWLYAFCCTRNLHTISLGDNAWKARNLNEMVEKQLVEAELHGIKVSNHGMHPCTSAC